MRKLLFILGIVTVALAGFTAPSLATNQNQAVALCEKSGACTITRHGSGINIFVSNGSGNSEIYCPDKGACECITCRTVTQSSNGKPSAGPVIRDKRTNVSTKPYVYTVTSVEQVLRLKYKRNRHSSAPMEGPSPNQTGGGEVLAPAAPTGTPDIIL
jgi:hypothetical protein